MNPVSFVLAIVAIVLFLVTAVGLPAKWSLTALGLAALASAWLLEATWTSASHIHF